MTTLDRALFSELLSSLNPAPTSDDIWRGSPHDVPELHKAATDSVFLEIANARGPAEVSPLGVAVLGRAGAGKTHMLGAIRERIQREQLGYFFLVSLNDGRSFWPSTAAALVDGFRRESPAWGTQHKSFFRRLTAELAIPPEVRDALAGDADLTPPKLDMFIRALRIRDSAVGRECQHTARALALQGSTDFDEQDIGELYLQSQVVDEPARSTWSLPAVARTPQQIVRDITRLIALTRSPAVIAFDQLDLLLEQTTAPTYGARDIVIDDASAWYTVAQGFVDLREKTQRTLIVVSCLPDTWTNLVKSAPEPFVGRFRTTNLPGRITSPELARRIIAARFAPILARRQIICPPTWPVKDEAFTNPIELTPRQLLRKVSAHLEHCLLTDTFSEMLSFTDAEQAPVTESSPKLGHLDVLDARFAELFSAAQVADALTPAHEDQQMTELLTAGLQAWIFEQQAPSGRYKLDVPHAGKPQVHGRLIEVLDEEKDREATWCFRAVTSPSANAVIARVRQAVTKAGITLGLDHRRLALLRNDPWPTGAKTQQVIQAATAAGAVTLPASEDDLKVFAALKQLLAEQDPDLRAWLISRRKASGTALFSAFLPGEPTVDTTRAPAVPRQRTTASTPQHGVFLGHLVPSGAPFAPDLSSLRKHVVIFAGSGSGKTVLVRRIIEECALLGVSSIVLDSNNDLVRLGQAWPEPPAEWSAEDAKKAADYFANVDVVVWTPKIATGLPLAFQPLPDFGSVLDNFDELGLAIDAAVAALAGRVGAAGHTEKAKKRRAVLTEVMRTFAASGGGKLNAFVDRLANLSDGESKLAGGKKIAQDLAEALKAEMINDVLFGGEGAAADPGMLLTPAAGKRARVSVISLVGLTPEQQTGFVNQLQMALFTWIKQHPAGDRPLGGLLVMDEAQNFAPAAGGPPSTESTIWLAQQARKYGLGLVFATQAPKGIHNKISGNAATQFFGRLSVPTQIEAAKSVAKSREADVSDIGTLKRGEFYVTNDDVSFVRIDTPLCLSYHSSPLTREEIVGLASSSTMSGDSG